MTAPLKDIVKVCPGCKIGYPANGFYKDPHQKSGLASYCRKCLYARVKKNLTTPRGKSIAIKSAKKMLKLRPKKYQAGNKLRYAVKMGRIIKPSECSKCGRNTTRIEAHHDDYDKPLAVRWLCTICHKIQHGRITDVYLLKEYSDEDSRL